MRRAVVAAGAAGLLVGCTQAPKDKPDDFGYDGTGIRVSIAPLTLDALSDACYSFAIESGALVDGDGNVTSPAELVVARGPQSPAGANLDNTRNSVCASRFGNGTGGDVSYVAPCDAQRPLHTVTLWVDALCDGDSDPADPSGGLGNICTEIQAYVNPCGTEGCALQVTCAENADTPVTFNFTIMGQADQGFFDIAVNFDDVFCSAKLDDCNTLDQKIRLVFDTVEMVLVSGGCPWGTGLAYGGLSAEENTLDYTGMNPDGCDAEGNAHYMEAPGDNAFAAPGPVEPNPTFGERIQTVVAAVACTAGPGDGVATQLNLSKLEIGCTDWVSQTFEGTYSLDFGNVTQEGNLMIGPFPAAVYYGTEALEGANKVYTTVAIGVGENAGCNIRWRVVPSDGAPIFEEPGTFTSFGFVDFYDGGLGGEECHAYELNGDGSAVTTQYHPTDAWIGQYDLSGVLSEAAVAFVPNRCQNDGEELALLEAEAPSIRAGAESLQASFEAYVLPEGYEKSLAVLRGRQDGLEARVGELQACEGFEAQTAALSVEAQSIRSLLVGAENLAETLRRCSLLNEYSLHTVTESNAAVLFLDRVAEVHCAASPFGDDCRFLHAADIAPEATGWWADVQYGYETPAFSSATGCYEGYPNAVGYNFKQVNAGSGGAEYECHTDAMQTSGQLFFTQAELNELHCWAMVNGRYHADSTLDLTDLEPVD